MVINKVAVFVEGSSVVKCFDRQGYLLILRANFQETNLCTIPCLFSNLALRTRKEGYVGT